LEESHDHDAYSVFGSGEFFDDIHSANAQVAANIKTYLGLDIRSTKHKLIWGKKVERRGSSDRSYLADILEHEGVVHAVPGKMSLSFWLAKAVAEYLGLPVRSRSAVRGVTFGEQFPNFAKPRHQSAYASIALAEQPHNNHA
jgi:hypothetical protein